jgi:hypothetical protein
MALRAAVANGNWSSTATWNGGVVPTVGDVVASNGFTVTINQNINVDSITNAAQAVVGAVPDMTSATTPSGIVTASQSETGLRAAFNAFEGDFNTEWWPSGAAWIAYEFPTPKAIDQYTVGTYGGTGSWTFEGWNGSTWIVLHTVVNTSFGYTSPLIGNSVAYIKYRLNYNPSAPSRLHTIQFYEYLGTSAAVAGGTFILNDGVTVTCTNATKGLAAQNTNSLNLLTYSGTGTATINANALYQNNTSSRDILFNSSGTLNIVGNFKTNVTSFQSSIAKTGTGILNFTGSMEMVSGYCKVLDSTAGTVNITGDCTITFCNGNSGSLINLSQTTANISGNLYLYNCTDRVTIYVISNSNNSILTITGTLTAQDPPTQTASGNFVINNSAYCKVIGAIICLYYRNQGYNSTSASAINILTGPFVSGPNGVQPIYVTRMHYQRTMGSYYEFRDNSTNGALPPAASAPATRLVSPDTIADSPIPANVRQGTVYSLGSQTGTMIVPSPSNVANNVPVDNTVGTAVLDPTAIWAVPLTSINTLNSIGRRVKNAATVETTGAQIQTTLNNNP